MHVFKPRKSVKHSAPIIKWLLATVGILGLGIAGCTQPGKFEAQAQDRRSIEQTDSTLRPSSIATDVKALVNLGPRVAGTPVMDQASAYLLQEYRKAGYVAEIQTFTYPKFEDTGSSLTVDGKTIKGRALNGSVAGQPTAPLVVVPNVGRSADFASVNTKGAIAIVRRGEIRFLDKARNAAAAGAVGLVVVNTGPDNVSGTLGGAVNIPVLTVSGAQGKPLLEQPQPEQQPASFVVNARQRTVTGRNVVAHLPGVTRPSVLLGGHYDSVPGSPGANDNASGTAVVLAIARNLANTPQARQTWFVAFDGEEDGLHGSRAFVKAAEPQFLQGLKGMLNFDMVGVNPQLRVGGTQPLTTLAKTANPEVSTFGGRGGSDHASFASAGVPVLFFYRGQEPNYHSPKDQQVDPNLLDQTAQVGLGVVQQLLKSEASAVPNQN